MGYKKRARDRFTASSLVCRCRGWIYGGVLDVTKKHAAGGVAERQRRFWKDEEYEGEFLSLGEPQSHKLVVWKMESTLVTYNVVLRSLTTRIRIHTKQHMMMGRVHPFHDAK